MDVQCDYLVVGTGSAGAVVANRLSSDPATAVVALEAGPPDKNRFIPIPAAFSKLFRSEIDWDYLTEPQQELDGREIYWPRGKVLGGSSSMNAMMWVRGFAADYDEWAVQAGPQWSFADVLGYFRRIENVTAAWTPVTPNARATTRIAASTSSVWAPDPSRPTAICIARRRTRGPPTGRSSGSSDASPWLSDASTPSAVAAAARRSFEGCMGTDRSGVGTRVDGKPLVLPLEACRR